VKLLVDQDIHSHCAAMLRALGHDAINAFEIGMNRSEDVLLIQYAVQNGHVIATLDSDYHEIVATQSLLAPSVILLRERCPPAELATGLIHMACMGFAPELEKGCLLTCRSKGTRLRMLPISRR